MGYLLNVQCVCVCDVVYEKLANRTAIKSLLCSLIFQMRRYSISTWNLYLYIYKTYIHIDILCILLFRGACIEIGWCCCCHYFLKIYSNKSIFSLSFFPANLLYYLHNITIYLHKCPLFIYLFFSDWRKIEYCLWIKSENSSLLRYGNWCIKS